MAARPNGSGSPAIGLMYVSANDFVATLGACATVAFARAAMV